MIYLIYSAVRIDMCIKQFVISKASEPGQKNNYPKCRERLVQT